MLHAVLFLEAILEVLEEFGWNNEESVLIDVFLLLRRWDGVAFLRFRPEVGEYFERGRSDILIDVFSDLGHNLISFCIGGVLPCTYLTNLLTNCLMALKPVSIPIGLAGGAFLGFSGRPVLHFLRMIEMSAYCTNYPVRINSAVHLRCL